MSRVDILVRAPQLSLNDRGETAFWSFINGTSDLGLLHGISRRLTSCPRDNQQIDGMPAGYKLARGGSSPKISPTGDIVMPVILSGPGITSNSDGFLLKGSLGHLSVVVREGDHAPGTPAGYFYTRSSLFADINNEGQIAFRVFLSGTVDNSNDSGIWATDLKWKFNIYCTRGRHNPSRSGDFTNRENTFTPGCSNGQDGFGRAFFQYSGQIVFRADFTDGSSGVFMATVPEPSTFTLFGIGAFALAAYTWRRRKYGT